MDLLGKIFTGMGFNASKTDARHHERAFEDGKVVCPILEEFLLDGYDQNDEILRNGGFRYRIVVGGSAKSMA
jgi:hypothetical protein